MYDWDNGRLIGSGGGFCVGVEYALKLNFLKNHCVGHMSTAVNQKSHLTKCCCWYPSQYTCRVRWCGYNQKPCSGTHSDLIHFSNGYMQHCLLLSRIDSYLIIFSETFNGIYKHVCTFYVPGTILGCDD